MLVRIALEQLMEMSELFGSRDEAAVEVHAWQMAYNGDMHLFFIRKLLLNWFL